MNLPAVALLTSLFASTPTESSTSAVSADQTFVLLIGYPEVPPDVPQGKRLPAVPYDLINMARFFSVLEPEMTIVHAPLPPISLQDDYEKLGREDATWMAVLHSVGTIRKRIDPARRSRVYVYYSGHGKQVFSAAGHLRSTIFLDPSGTRDTPALRGTVMSNVFAEKVLQPLSAAGAEVHLIVDACQSFYMLQAKDVEATGRARKGIPREGGRIISEFGRRFAKVGASLATNGGQRAFEDPRYGGLFSYALRSAAIGQADENKDRRISYGELAKVTPQIIEGLVAVVEPAFIGYQNDLDTIFIDYNESSAAVITLPRSYSERIELRAEDNTHYAVLHPPKDRELLINLPAKEQFRFERGLLDFVLDAVAGTWDELMREVGASASKDASGVSLNALGKPLERPISFSRVVPPSRSASRPQSHWGLSVAMRGVARTGDGPADFRQMPGGEARIRWGAGRPQYSFAVRGEGRSVTRDNGFRYIGTHVLGVGGFDYHLDLIPGSPIETSIGARFGAGAFIQWPVPSATPSSSPVVLGTFRTQVLVPLVATQGVYLAVEGGLLLTCPPGLCDKSDFGATFAVDIGWDVEFPE